MKYNNNTNEEDDKWDLNIIKIDSNVSMTNDNQ